MKLPNKKYAVIYADPPWQYKTYNEKGRSRCPDWRSHKDAAAKHYETMTFEDIKNLPVSNMAADDCVLLVWVTMPFLQQAFEVIESWGFKYKTCGFAWMKRNKNTPSLFIDASDIFMGTGYWTRSNCELCLLATKGKPKRQHADVPQALFTPLRQHSRKPTEVYERIERLLNGPYIELFSRTKRSGWDMVGDQLGKFVTPSPNHRGDSSGGNPKPRKKRKPK